MRLLVYFLFLVSLSQACLAEQNSEKKTVSPALYKKLSEAEKLIERKAYSKAEVILNETLKKVKTGDYEEAVVLRTMASNYALQEKYSKAADALSKCLALKVLPKKQQQQALLNLGQIYMAEQQFAKAVKTLKPWLKANSSPDAEVAILLANAYAQLKKYRIALPYVEQAIKMTKKPAESWYQLNLSLYYELENFAAAAVILQKLVAQYPKNKQYWFQLASVYQQEKNYKKALSIKNLAYKKGLYTRESDINELVNLYFLNDLPYQAAQLLKTEMNNGKIKKNSKTWEQLANAWTQAKEFEQAIQALEQASKLNPNGNLYFRLGRIFFEQEQWTKAISSIKKGLKKGNIGRPGDAYLLLGISYHEQKNRPLTRQAFNKARNFKNTAKAARHWLDYIASENIAP